MHLRQVLYPVAALLLAALLAGLGAWRAAVVIETKSAAAVHARLVEAGITWADVSTDGLQVRLSGTAPTEAARFRVVSLVGTVVQAARVRDDLDVAAMAGVQPPRFSVEMLRNDDGISLIGLVPGAEGKTALAGRVEGLANGVDVSDMLENADYPPPEGWSQALDFGLVALNLLPRAKISVAADRVSITAIAVSTAEKKTLQSDLARAVPEGLDVKIDISAPRPVLTPFTLRFVKDEGGARFDACAADTDRARTRILAAGVKAGTTGKIACTVGLGVPTQRWADGAEAGIAAVTAMGSGTVTFSDADVTLMAGGDVTQAGFDRVVGDLQAQLPPIFSLKATMPPKTGASPAGPVEFSAKLGADGRAELRGRLADEAMKTTVDSFAKALFGASRVYTATRFDANLPEGWPVRVLAGLQALEQLHDGTLLVRPDVVEVTGTTGRTDAQANISQILSKELGQGRIFRVDVTYDKQLDPLAALPTPQECVADMDKIMTVRKITFDPGSAEIDGNSRTTIDALSAILMGCPAMDMEIAGYTDSQGSDGGNRALSQARAEAVLTALQGRRLPVEAFVAKGYGEDDPVADNATEAGRDANRRIEFHLLGKQKTTEPASAPPRVKPAPLPSASSPQTASTASGADPVATTDPDLSEDTENVMEPGATDGTAMDDTGSGDEDYGSGDSMADGGGDVAYDGGAGDGVTPPGDTDAAGTARDGTDPGLETETGGAALSSLPVAVDPQGQAPQEFAPTSETFPRPKTRP